MIISQAARQAGVGVETIRYYERCGLIRRPVRPVGAYRRYSRETVERIRTIKRLQSLGFSLEEIGRLLATDELSCEQVQALLREKIARLARQVGQLRAHMRFLQQGLAQCERQTGCESCLFRDYVVHGKVPEGLEIADGLLCAMQAASASGEEPEAS